MIHTYVVQQRLRRIGLSAERHAVDDTTMSTRLANAKRTNFSTGNDGFKRRAMMQEPLLKKKSSKMGLKTQLGLFAGTVLLVTLSLHRATVHHHTMLINFPTTSSVLPTSNSYYQVENYPGISVRVRVDVPLCMYACVKLHHVRKTQDNTSITLLSVKILSSLLQTQDADQSPQLPAKFVTEEALADKEQKRMMSQLERQSKMEVQQQKYDVIAVTVPVSVTNASMCVLIRMVLISA